MVYYDAGMSSRVFHKYQKWDFPIQQRIPELLHIRTTQISKRNISQKTVFTIATISTIRKMINQGAEKMQLQTTKLRLNRFSIMELKNLKTNDQRTFKHNVIFDSAKFTHDCRKQ